MKISQIKIKNFRSYYHEITVDIENLIAFVGKNDVGKSTILEALDIFFNEGKGVIKLDKEDINKKCVGDDIVISILFNDLPEKIIIDSTNQTVLKDEYLLNKDGKLEVVKKYPNAGKEKVFIKAYHPTNSNCSELLLKRQKELQNIISKENIDCNDKKTNALMRQAIWKHYSGNLKLEEIEIEATKEDAKNTWEQLKNYMPLYSLFQSDRKNSDGDSEIQDPMKLAVREILRNEGLQKELKHISENVTDKLANVANKTLEKLKEINPEIASRLKPIIPPYEKLRWDDVFKGVSISGDEDIPINKRGSGVKRLVLLSFFRAEIERRQSDMNVQNIIYAVEEPETSQHTDHQRKLIDAFIELSENPNTQIIFTTHSPPIVKMLKFENLKLIEGGNTNKIVNIQPNLLPYPSLNEVNYLAFGEVNEEYHNELYGRIAGKKLLNKYEEGKRTKEYKRVGNSTPRIEKIIHSKYIRHQIHHPENEENSRYTLEELRESIIDMREFLESQSP